MNEAIRYALFETREPAVHDLKSLFTIFQNEINPADVSDWIRQAKAFADDFERFRVGATDALIALKGGAK